VVLEIVGNLGLELSQQFSLELTEESFEYSLERLLTGTGSSVVSVVGHDD
jgi:hypothetical protein